MILRIIILRTSNNTITQRSNQRPSGGSLEWGWWQARGIEKGAALFWAAPPLVPASPLTTERGPPPWRGACRSSSEPTLPCR